MFRGDARHSGRYKSPAFNGFEAVQWAFKTGGKVFSSPAVAEGVAYFGSEDKHLYAVDARSGKALWKFATGGAVHASPAVFRGTVYFTSFDGYCYALDARTGGEKWRFQTDGKGISAGSGSGA
jgi:outer membrane protein assembly factor BamB